ncbi:hypothetical protein SUGI_0304810 [Cryptomeria japonica]|nr:hypothetical protein SUGI_0304810 [Cryptomeria japonica]
MLDVGQPLTKRLTALRRARSLRDPTTSLLKFSPPAARSSWDLPNDTEEEEEEEEEDEAECESRHDGFAYSKRDSAKFTSPWGAEKSSVSRKTSGRLSGDFKNLKQALDQESSTEELSINRSDIGISHENGLKRRDEGERAVLHNWPNECFDDECRDPVRNERDFPPRRSVDESKISISRREIEHGNGERTATKQGRRDRLFKGGKKDSVSRSANVSPSLHNSAEAFSLFLLDQEDPCEDGDDKGGLSWMHRSRASGVDCDSRSGSPLLMRDDVKCREQTGKNNKKIYSNISKYIGKQKEDSQTPTSVRSVNNDGKSSIRGSCDGTAFSGDDEMDGLDLPRHGCGIPCYWPRTPRHRSKNFPDSRGRNLSCGPANSVRRKSSNILPRSKIAAQKDLMSSAYDSKRSEELNLDMEVLPLLTDVGETAASSAEDGCDGFSNDSRDLFLEEASRLNRKRSRHKGREKLELALTSESRELTVYTDMHRSLSQKYRPRSFDELVGQNMVVQSLVNAVLKGKVAPVYLFQGPRGTGKTSTARIFATALNCISLEELRPCGLCRECTAFASGKSGDVREVDATNSNGLDKVKSLLKNVASAPSFSRFKIFIIDECHMLVSETWTALLKCLEEPPAHAVFILVTTDPDKLPDTAVSRCQKYLFPKIKESEIVSRLQKLAIEENLDVDTDALDFIAIKADGSLRDAETMLDQLSLLGQRITLSMVHDLVSCF